MRTPATSEEQAEYKALLADKFARLGKLTSRYAWLKQVQFWGGFVLAIGLPIAVGTYWGQASTLVAILAVVSMVVNLFFWRKVLTKKQAEDTFFDIAQASEVNYHRFGVYELDKYDSVVSQYKNSIAQTKPFAYLYITMGIMSYTFMAVYDMVGKDIKNTGHLPVIKIKKTSALEHRIRDLEYRIYDLKRQNNPKYEHEIMELQIDADSLEKYIYIF